MTAIPQFPADAPVDEIAAALGQAGCVVVTDVMDPELRRAISSELEPHMSTVKVIQEDDPEQFYPGKTRRVSALVARSPSVTDQLIAHPVSQQMCDSHLLPNGEFGYQLHVSAALEVGPGAREQILHREEGSFTFFPLCSSFMNLPNTSPICGDI